jgi:hypothetical protein
VDFVVNYDGGAIRGVDCPSVVDAFGEAEDAWTAGAEGASFFVSLVVGEGVVFGGSAGGVTVVDGSAEVVGAEAVVGEVAEAGARFGAFGGDVAEDRAERLVFGAELVAFVPSGGELAAEVAQWGAPSIP